MYTDYMQQVLGKLFYVALSHVVNFEKGLKWIEKKCQLFFFVHMQLLKYIEKELGAQTNVWVYYWIHEREMNVLACSQGTMVQGLNDEVMYSYQFIVFQRKEIRAMWEHKRL